MTYILQIQRISHYEDIADFKDEREAMAAAQHFAATSGQHIRIIERTERRIWSQGGQGLQSSLP